MDALFSGVGSSWIRMMAPSHERGHVRHGGRRLRRAGGIDATAAVVARSLTGRACGSLAHPIPYHVRSRELIWPCLAKS